MLELIMLELVMLELIMLELVMLELVTLELVMLELVLLELVMLGAGELVMWDEPVLVLVLVGEDLLHQLVLQQVDIHLNSQLFHEIGFDNNFFTDIHSFFDEMCFEHPENKIKIGLEWRTFTDE